MPDFESSTDSTTIEPFAAIYALHFSYIYTIKYSFINKSFAGNVIQACRVIGKVCVLVPFLHLKLKAEMEIVDTVADVNVEKV